MTEAPTGPQPRLVKAASAITSPIPLLAFLGIVVEGVVGSLVFTLKSSTLGSNIIIALVVSSIALPVLFGGLIYTLLTRHYYKLYAPRDFGDPQDFVRVLDIGRQDAERLGRVGATRGYQPWILSHEASGNELHLIEARVRSWEPVLDAMHPEEFLAIHSWYNERGDHTRALLAIDITIARGIISSQVFSYRSASLRKLGRLAEAQSCANLALAFDSANIDAHYNLSKTLLAAGERAEALEHARLALRSGKDTYGKQLQALFPELGNASIGAA